MKLDLTAKFRFVENGNTYKEHDRELTMKDVLLTALRLPIDHSVRNEETQMKRWKHIKQISGADKIIDIPREDIAYLKECVAKLSVVEVVGQAIELMEYGNVEYNFKDTDNMNNVN